MSSREDHIINVIFELKQEINDLKFQIAAYREELVTHRLICVECGRLGENMSKPITLVHGEPLCATCREAYDYMLSLLE